MLSLPSHLGHSEQHKTSQRPQHRVPEFEETYPKACSAAQGWVLDCMALKSLLLCFLVGHLGARDVTLLSLSSLTGTLRIIMAIRGIVNEL